MGTLNAAPNQNPFAFECNANYRTGINTFKIPGTQTRYCRCDNSGQPAEKYPHRAVGYLAFLQFFQLFTLGN
jgi:hypothetical protein